jgi:hypothetical protein
MIFPEKTSPEIRYVEKISRDTIEIVRQAEPLVITRTKVKIRELRDTIILEKPHVAELDTVLSGDTISAAYFFPDREMSLRVGRPPDSLKIIEILKMNECPKQPWWEGPLYFLAGAGAGFVIANNK